MTTINYGELQAAVAEKLKDIAARRNELRAEVEATRQKAIDENTQAETLAGEIAKLKSMLGEALAQGQAEYQRVKASLRTKTIEHETLTEIVATLQTDVLPRLQAELAEMDRYLSDGLKAACREHLPQCQQRIDELVADILDEHDAWVEAWERIGQAYGQGFPSGKTDLRPKLEYSRIDKRLPGMIALLSVDERIERLKESK